MQMKCQFQCHLKVMVGHIKVGVKDTVKCQLSSANIPLLFDPIHMCHLHVVIVLHSLLHGVVMFSQCL